MFGRLLLVFCALCFGLWLCLASDDANCCESVSASMSTCKSIMWGLVMDDISDGCARLFLSLCLVSVLNYHDFFCR